jgi:hypothetical protein
VRRSPDGATGRRMRVWKNAPRGAGDLHRRAGETRMVMLSNRVHIFARPHFKDDLIWSWGAEIRSCSSPILMQQPAEQVASMHPTFGLGS